MVIAVIADTHMPRGARRLADRCCERMAGADLIIHAGDFVTVAVMDDIESFGPPLASVHGNMDSDELRRRLPVSRVVEACGASIGMIHDAGLARGRLERMRRRFPDADAVVFGHSHIPLHEERNGFQIFNPGSPTDRRRQPRHTMGMATARRGSLGFELVALD